MRQCEHWRWVKIIPYYTNWLDKPYIGEGIVIHIPLFQDAQNIMMDKLWKLFSIRAADLNYLNIIDVEPTKIY